MAFIFRDTNRYESTTEQEPRGSLLDTAENLLNTRLAKVLPLGIVDRLTQQVENRQKFRAARHEALGHIYAAEGLFRGISTVISKQNNPTATSKRDYFACVNGETRRYIVRPTNQTVHVDSKDALMSVTLELARQGESVHRVSEINLQGLELMWQTLAGGTLRTPGITALFAQAAETKRRLEELEQLVIPAH